MRTITVIGVCADRFGHSISHSYSLDERGAAHHHRDIGAVPASSYHVTKDRIPVDWRHGRYLGDAVYLERNANLTVVAEIDIDLLSGINLFEAPLFWSPETWEERSRHGTVTAELLAIALTPSPASVALPPVHILAGDLEVAARGADSTVAALLHRAAAARRRRSYSGDPIRIHDLDDQPPAVQRLERSYDGVTFLNGELLTEKRTTPPLSDDARRIGIRRIEHSGHHGRIISVR